MAVMEISGARIAVRVTAAAAGDAEKNRSAVTVTKVEVRSLVGNAGSCFVTGTVRIDGTAAVQLQLSGSVGCAVMLGSSYAGGGRNWSGWSDETIYVNHSADGTKTVSVSVQLTLTGVNGTVVGSVSGAGKLVLPRLARASVLKGSWGALGQPVTITILRSAQTAADTVGWQCGDQTGVIAERTGQTRLEWTPPLELAAQAPDAQEVPITLTVKTFDGEASIGESSLNILCPIPEEVVPAVQVTAEDRLEYAEQYGGFVQGQSAVWIRTDARGAYGSRIVKITVVCGGLRAEGNDVVLVLPDCNGTLEVTALDSRGRKAVHREVLTVIPRSVPMAQIEDILRCDREGNPQAEGDWAKVIFSGRITPMDGKNAAQWFLHTRPRDGGQWVQRQIPIAQWVPEHAEYCFPAGIDSGYECFLTARDSFGSNESAVVTLGAAFALIDVCRGTKAVGLGQRANADGMVSVGLDMKLSGHRIREVSPPLLDGDCATAGWVRALLEALYPVGSIYASLEDSCAPAQIIGGTWVRIEDVFLLASGKNAAGTTGGAESHSHTVTGAARIYPSTAGNLIARRVEADSWLSNAVLGGAGSWSAAESERSMGSQIAGTAQETESLPPYLSVNIWRRTE